MTTKANTEKNSLEIKQESMDLRRDTRGLSSVEYLILLVVVAIAGITVWTKVGKSISTKADSSSTSIDTLGGGTAPSN